jgi:hypothetical protein
MKMSQAAAKMAQIRSRHDASGNAAVAPMTTVEMINPAHVEGRDSKEFGPLDAIELANRVPGPTHHSQERRVDQGELRPGRAGGLAGEDGEQREKPHLEEHQQPRPAILAPVQLDVQRAVEPGKPEHREHNDEPDEALERDVLRQVVRGLRDHCYVREVVEQLEVADGPILQHRAVRSRRRRQPALELRLRRLGHRVER